MSDDLKTGRLSHMEMQYIRDNAHHVNYIDIAAKMKRRPEAVKKFIEENMNMETSLRENAVPVGKTQYEYDLEQEEYWKTLQNQFSPNELEIFRYQWNQFYEQFGGDVLPTEKLQIIDTIKLEILMNSTLIERRKALESIELLEMQQEAIRKGPDGEERSDLSGQEREELRTIERNINFHRVAQQTLLKEFRDLQDKKTKMFTTLKGTRQQRIERIESATESFSAWMSEIIENPQRRKDCQANMEKMRLAVIDEAVRLSAYHKYEDGVVDQPLLTPETVKEDNGKMSTGENDGTEASDEA